MRPLYARATQMRVARAGDRRTTKSQSACDAGVLASLSIGCLPVCFSTAKIHLGGGCGNNFKHRGYTHLVKQLLSLFRFSASRVTCPLKTRHIHREPINCKRRQRNVIGQLSSAAVDDLINQSFPDEIHI